MLWMDGWMDGAVAKARNKWTAATVVIVVVVHAPRGDDYKNKQRPSLARLSRLASPLVSFLLRLSDSDVRPTLNNARPSIEGSYNKMECAAFNEAHVDVGAAVG